jgi:hypothetical protein
MSLLPPSSGAAKAFSVPPLTCSGRDGKLYQRRKDIEARIASIINLDTSNWVAEAKGLPAEVLVYLTRAIASFDADVAGRLIFELSDRTHRVVIRWARGFSKIEIEEIVHTIDRQIIELVLVPEPSNQSEILEVAFSEVVKRWTLKEVSKVQNRPSSSKKSVDTENPPERPDEGVGAQERLLQMEDAARLPELLRKAEGAVRDPRHYEVLVLRYCYDWPIESNDPEEPTLAKRYGVSPRQIRNWIAKGLETIRTALGVTL